MSRGAGLWPGGRERSVPPGFPGEQVHESGPQGRAKPRQGYRPRRYLDESTVEEPRPSPPAGRARPRRDQDDLGRRYARDEDRDDRPPPRRLARIGEPPPPGRPVPGAGVWREPRHLRPAEPVEELVEGVVPASRWDRDEPRPSAPVPEPDHLDGEPDVLDEAAVDDEDDDDRRRPPSWYRRGDDDDIAPTPRSRPRPRLVPDPVPGPRPTRRRADDTTTSSPRPRLVPAPDPDVTPEPQADPERRSARRRGDDVAASSRSHPRSRPTAEPDPEERSARRRGDDVAEVSRSRPVVEPDGDHEPAPEVATDEPATDEPARARWEPRPIPDPEPGRRPTRRPHKRLVAAADARVQPAVAASRRAHPTARPAAAAGPGRLASRWPGSNAGALPPDFPGGNGGDVVFRRPRPRALAATDPPKRRRSRNTTGPNDQATPPDTRSEAEARDGGRRPLPLRPPQRLNNIVGAVYAALADPLAADSAEAREQRAARVREIGLIAASSALVAVLVYGIFPVRTFLNQRAATDEAQERLDKIAEANERMRREAERLRDDEEIELRARTDYGWVFPGEESYGVMPSPVAEPAPDATDPDGTTTTTTTPEG